MRHVLNTELPLTWDIFCQVVDNHGDLGVCWRLSSQLAALGQRVRLWIDDASALPWMAPGALEQNGTWPGVQVLPWQPGLPNASLNDMPPADVWIEAFGCEIPPEFLVHFRGNAAEDGTTTAPPVWINLEYLSAESYVERMHRLPSPVMHGPAAGLTKWFFYPGFTPRTGGLLREPDLATRQAAFDRSEWLAAQDIPWNGERLISLFCYEPSALIDWLAYLAQDERPTRLLVTPGRATAAVQMALSGRPVLSQAGKLSFSYLPHLPQYNYDELLWTCDMNFVRGEDSLVRALWAGKPFVWQIYPQDDDAHHLKLNAFLDWLQAPVSLRKFHRIWNGIDKATESASHAPASQHNPIADMGLDLTTELPVWLACAQAARNSLYAQDDLATQLMGFVAEKR